MQRWNWWCGGGAAFLLPKSYVGGPEEKHTLQISIGWLSVISSVIPLALKGILPMRIIPIGKIIQALRGLPMKLPITIL